MLTQMDVRGVMACTHDHAPLSKRISPLFPPAVHKCTLSLARLIMASIARLGFDIKDVKVLLNSEPHPDHGGGLAVLQQASGAQLWASDASADSLASGGDDPDIVLPLRALIWMGVSATGHARRPPVQGRRHDPCRADRAHRAYHRRPYARLHDVVVSRARR